MIGKRNTSSGKHPKRALVYGILMAVGFGLVLLQTAPNISASLTSVRTSVSDQQVGNGSGSWFARITGQTARNERIKALEAEVRDLQHWRAAAITMAERMESYEKILNVQGEPLAQGFTARIISESDGPFADTLLANAGENQGIKLGFVAVNEGGLVGRVVQLGKRSSRILMVTDFNSRIPVVGEASGVRAILYGGRDGFGALQDRPELDPFIAGERILTTGDGGVFPRGIIAGYAQKRGNNWRVDYAMNRGTAGFVRLLPPILIPKPEDEPIAGEAGDEASEEAGEDTGVTSRLAGQ